jgi:hypothetical protein
MKGLKKMLLYDNLFKQEDMELFAESVENELAKQKTLVDLFCAATGIFLSLWATEKTVSIKLLYLEHATQALGQALLDFALDKDCFGSELVTAYFYTIGIAANSKQSEEDRYAMFDSFTRLMWQDITRALDDQGAADEDTSSSH